MDIMGKNVNVMAIQPARMNIKIYVKQHPTLMKSVMGMENVTVENVYVKQDMLENTVLVMKTTVQSKFS